MIVLNDTRRATRVNGLKIVVPTPLYGGSLPVALHTAAAFRELGHAVDLIDFAHQYDLYRDCADKVRDDRQTRALQGSLAAWLADFAANVAITQQADLVWFTAQSPISVKSLRALREAGVRTAFWFVEDIGRFNYWPHIATEVDFFFSIQQGQALQEIAKVGARRVEYLPCAANPAAHRPMSLSREQQARYGSEVSFVGAGYPNRVALFKSLEENIALWGNDWPQGWSGRLREGGRRVTTEETALIFNATTINLNIHSASSREVFEDGDFVNPRTFEIAACRKFQIASYRSPMKDLLTESSEIVMVRSTHELQQAIVHFREHPAEREAIAAAAYDRVLNQHTYTHRMSQALQHMDLVTKRSPKHELPTIEDLKTAAWGDEEIQRHFAKFANESPARLDELVTNIPAGERELTRPELLLLLMNEFRHWGIEKSAIQ